MAFGVALFRPKALLDAIDVALSRNKYFQIHL